MEVPANNTARPLVSMASTTASSTSSPAFKPSRYRVTMARSRLMPAQAGHIATIAEGEVRHGDEVAAQRDQGRADPETEQATPIGSPMAVPNQRDDEDDDGGDEGRRLARRQFELGEEVPSYCSISSPGQGGYRVSEVLDLAPQVQEFLELPRVGDVELSETRSCRPD
ncbi:MAG: hypothetical protein R2715_22345 [Ilumatobacteraceae bacterium]